MQRRLSGSVSSESALSKKEQRKSGLKNWSRRGSNKKGWSRKDLRPNVSNERESKGRKKRDNALRRKEGLKSKGKRRRRGEP